MADDVRRATPAQAEANDQAESGAGLEKIAVTGGLLGAIAASTCCVLPLGLAVFGIGGAWLSSLRALAAFQPLFLALAIGAIGYGFYRIYWRSKRNCADDKTCARPAANRLATSGLWLASLIVAIVVSFPYWFGALEPYLP
jgi:mercuric ion transport protein